MPPSVQLAFQVHRLSCCSFFLLFFWSLSRCWYFIPCEEFQWPYLGKGTAAARVVLPILASVCVCVCVCVCSVFVCPKLQACQWLGFLPCMQVLCIWLLTQLQKLFRYCNSKGVYTASWLEETNWVGHASAYIKPSCQSGSAWFSSVLNVIGVTVSTPQFFFSLDYLKIMTLNCFHSALSLYPSLPPIFSALGVAFSPHNALFLADTVCCRCPVCIESGDHTLCASRPSLRPGFHSCPIPHALLGRAVDHTDDYTQCVVYRWVNCVTHTVTFYWAELLIIQMITPNASFTGG